MPPKTKQRWAEKLYNRGESKNIITEMKTIKELLANSDNPNICIATAVPKII